MIFSPLWNNTFFTFIHQNHTIERRWPEINNRVNYPLKEALVQLVDQELIDMDCSLTRYCVSNLSCQLCHLGISRVVEAWNNHMISGMLNNVQNITLDKHLTFITNFLRVNIPQMLQEKESPTSSDRVVVQKKSQQHYYPMELKQLICTWIHWELLWQGQDPFTSEHEKSTVEQLFSEKWPDINELLNNTVNKNFLPFKEALISLVSLTQRYS